MCIGILLIEYKMQNTFLINISGKIKTLVLATFKYSSVIITIMFCFKCSLNNSFNCSPHSNESYKFIILVFQFLSKIMPSL